MTDIVERLQAAMNMEPEVNSFEAMRDAKAEIERLQARLVDAGAFTLSERWSQQEAEIERLTAENLRLRTALRLADGLKDTKP